MDCDARARALLPKVQHLSVGRARVRSRAWLWECTLHGLPSSPCNRPAEPCKRSCDAFLGSRRAERHAKGEQVPQLILTNRALQMYLLW